MNRYENFISALKDTAEDIMSQPDSPSRWGNIHLSIKDTKGAVFDVEDVYGTDDCVVIKISKRK